MKIGGRMLVHLFFALSLLALNLPLGFASLQSPTATLNGRVVDPNKALVAGAKVDATNEETNVTSSTETNAEGLFVLPNLPTGRYRVTVQKEGFQTIVKPDVELHVQAQVSLNFTMDIGSVVQSVTVVGGAPLIQNESPSVGTLVDRQFVETLPLNGRSFQALITLTPGIVLAKTNVQSQGQFNVNGQRANANYFTVDGVGANIGASASTFPGQSGAGSLPALTASGGTNNLVSIDALQEFRIQTSTFAPEFGRTPGAQISIVTRSGTNEWHGIAFDYLRNDALDANDWFANRQGLPKPALRQNDFGGVLGGPIRKDRAFFFFSYEGLRLRQPLVGIEEVPSLATRASAPAAVQPLINLYPKPNGPDEAGGLATFASSFSNPTTLNAESLRVDGSVTDNMTLFGRYNYAPSSTVARGFTGAALNSLQHFQANAQTVTLGVTALVTPRMSNDLRFNYSRSTAESFFTVDGFGGAQVPSDQVLFPPNQSSQNAAFTLSITGPLNSVIFLGKAPANVQRQFNVIDGLSLIRGNHQVKIGFDYRRLSPMFEAPGYQESLRFSSVGTAPSPQPGTVLSGEVSGQIASQVSPQVAIFNNLSLYAQDTWHVAPRLTLTYGLRWEFDPVPYSANGRDPLAINQVDSPATIQFAARGASLCKTTYGNLAPRLGVSYQLTNKPGAETVLRGGFGLFYDLGDGQASNAFVASFPFVASRNFSNIPFPLSAADAAVPVPGAAPGTSLFYGFDPNLRLPRVYQWNVSVEQAAGANQSVAASYVGAVGRRLLRQEFLLGVDPLIPFLFLTKNAATSDYHALEVQFRRRLSRGLQGLLSYTWSKSLDSASGDSAFGTPDTRFDPAQDRGPSDFDVRHALSGAITYNLPGLKTGAIGKALLSDWSLDSIIAARTATPVNVTYSNLSAGIPVTLRPDLLPNIPLYLDSSAVAGGRQLNPAAYSAPPTLRQGTLERNGLRGFGVWQLDLALRRQFHLAERIKLQFRAEFFNLFNHPNFADPSGSLGSKVSGPLVSPSFGLSTSMLGRSLGSGGITGGFNPLYQVGGPRSIQMSLKVLF